MPHHHGKHHTHQYGDLGLPQQGLSDAAHALESHLHSHQHTTNSIPEKCSTCHVDIGEVQIVGEKHINHVIIDTDAGELVVLEPRFASPEEANGSQSVVTATILNIIAGTQTIAEFTVTSLPAVVSNSDIGIITIPANLHTPLVVTHFSIPQPTSTSSSGTESAPKVTIAIQSSLLSSSSSLSSLSSSSSTSTSSSLSSSSSNSHTPSSTSPSSTGPITISSLSPSPSPSSLSSASTTSLPLTATSSASGSSSSSTPRIVGGVVGGVGGILLLLLIGFFLFRWQKHRNVARNIGGTPRNTRANQRLDSSSTGMSRRSTTASPEVSSRVPSSPSIFPWWRASTQTASTVESTTSERGFQKISGRKIPSVLHTGGDGYGGLREDEPVSSQRAAGGGRAGQSSSNPSSPQHSISQSRSPVSHPSPSNERLGDSSAILRPGPGTPVAQSVNMQPASSDPITGRQSAEPIHDVLMPPRPDALGRSLSNYDGSRGSRFTESIE